MQIPQISNFTPGLVDGAQKSNQGTNVVDSASKTFGQILDSLSTEQNQSDSLMSQLAAGENVDVHQAVISAEETDVNFRVAMAIRDRLVDAYHEVMRMSV
jgi:flagellar hook-basal body complex protein FliE